MANDNENLLREKDAIIAGQAQRIAEMESKLALREAEISRMANSRSWKITAPLRKGKNFVHDAMIKAALELGAAKTRARRMLGKKKRVAMISECYDYSGHVYRMERMAKAIGGKCEIEMFPQARLRENLARAAGADIIWIWRAEYSPLLMQVIDHAHKRGIPVIFDIDDLCFHPDHFSPEFMDAIRHRHLNIVDMRRYGERMLTVANAADICCATTWPLARQLYLTTCKPTFVLRNTYDAAYRRACVQARAKFLAEKEDDFVRIGYPAGTITHQADMAEAMPALIRVLQKHPECRLVLFRAIDLAELPELDKARDSIEMRDLVPWQEFPNELARFDINIAPLESGNFFCDCKSELKFFESALMAVPTVASNTPPFAEAIIDGENGFLANCMEEWEAKLDRLVSDRNERERMGRAARRSVAWRFGPEYLAESAGAVIDYATGNENDRARAFLGGDADEAEHDEKKAWRELPLPGCEIVWSSGPAVADLALMVENPDPDSLDSLLRPDCAQFDLVAVNGALPDKNILAWFEKNGKEFSSATLLQADKFPLDAAIDHVDSEKVFLVKDIRHVSGDSLTKCADKLVGGLYFAKDPAGLMFMKAHWALVGGFGEKTPEKSFLDAGLLGGDA